MDTTIGITLGNNQTLKPKVYYIGAASTLTGNLILDAQGDSNALFIFKIGGALITATHTNVILINSASLKNVYWQVYGLFTLGDSSIFRGTVVADGAINLLQGSSLFGRGLTIAGAINLHTNINSLPVELLSFNAICYNQSVVINGVQLPKSITIITQ